MNPLEGWENFYTIVGSSAGALIGLQFVVMTLVAQKTNMAVQQDTSEAFSTPTIVHFSMVLLLSAVTCAPWRSAAGVEDAWLVAGAVGIGYSLLTVWRAARQNTYKMVATDWVYYMLLPLVAYCALAGSAVASRGWFRESQFGVAAVALLLLFIGIRNAWDGVTYHVFAPK